MEANDVESQVLSKVYEEMQQRYVGFDDPAHGWEHINRVYRLAVYIAEQENADIFIVGMAALMHDIGHLSTDTSLHHADLSMSMAGELLISLIVFPLLHERQFCMQLRLIASVWVSNLVRWRHKLCGTLIDSMLLARLASYAGQ